MSTYWWQTPTVTAMELMCELEKVTARAENAEAACKAAVDNAMELARERDAAQDEVARLRHNEKVLQDTIQEMARRNAKLEAVAEAAQDISQYVVENWAEAQASRERLLRTLDALDGKEET